MTFHVIKAPETPKSGLHVEKGKGVSSAILKEKWKNKTIISKTGLC